MAKQNTNPNNELLCQLSNKIIEKKPATALPGTRKKIRDSFIGADKESVWSKIHSEMQEDEKTRALDIP